jgi:Tfp pilus assembly protein PilX
MSSKKQRDEKGKPAMGMLRVISKRGDDRVQWNERDAQAGDAEASAAIREAERIFAQERSRGATAFRVETGKPAERIEQFDPQAEQIILVPRVVGG